MFPDRFKVKALAAKSNVQLLAEQINQFLPDIAVLVDESRVHELKKLIYSGHRRVEILCGQKGCCEAASYDPVHTVVIAVVGAIGLLPTLAAIDAGKKIALATKETLVMAGEYVMARAAAKGVSIIPIDSEHSAIYQCLLGERPQDIDCLILTASGGPFFKRPAEEFHAITPQDALKHPTWQMGKKITIDSATLMNKGLEVIEARHLFNIPEHRIKVVIHPQSIIHSMVTFIDGSVKAQLGIPDMKTAIAYALSFPERLPLNQPIPDFPTIGQLSFFEPDLNRFPCLSLAYQACNVGKTMPAVMNAANEIAVEAFLDRKIKFTDIPKIIQNTMNQHTVGSHTDIDDILNADQWVRNHQRRIIDAVIV